MRKRVLVAYERSIFAPFSQLEELAEVVLHTPVTEEDWVEKIRETDVLIPICDASAGKITRRVIDAAKRLKLIQTFSTGYDHIDMGAATERGIIVCNVEEVISESVAQLTWAHILALSRRIPNADRAMRSGYFMRPGKWGAMHDDDIYFYRGGPLLWGKTLGLIGLGDIGSRVALKGLHAFKMKILVYDPYVLPARAQMYGADLVTLEKVLRNSDVVSIHCPLTRETYHLISERELNMMKKSAFIVNTARGPIIDEEALIKGLQRGTIAGAGLDTYEKEPLSADSPLLKLENTILTPHNGSTLEALQKLHQGAIENVIRFLEGETPHWMVNPKVLENTYLRE